MGHGSIPWALVGLVALYLLAVVTRFVNLKLSSGRTKKEGYMTSNLKMLVCSWFETTWAIEASYASGLILPA